MFGGVKSSQVADNSEKWNQKNSPEFPDEAIRRFLFGRLSAAEQMTFEEVLIADDALETRVRLAECELADDYAFGRLSTAERELFEQRFLVSAARQQKLRVSKALRARFASASVVPTAAPSAGTTLGEKLQRLLGLKQPSWRPAISLVILILLLGSIWVMRKPQIRERLISQTQRLIPRRRPAPAKTPATDAEVSHHASNASPAPQQETPSPLEQERPASATGIVVLVPEKEYDRDGIAQVSVARTEGNILHIKLAIERNQPGTYRGELLTVAGQSVFTEASLKPAAGNASIDFDVPVRFLKAGDYQVKLSRVTDGIEEGVAAYYFRVQ